MDGWNSVLTEGFSVEAIMHTYPCWILIKCESVLRMEGECTNYPCVWPKRHICSEVNTTIRPKMLTTQ